MARVDEALVMSCRVARVHLSGPRHRLTTVQSSNMSVTKLLLIVVIAKRINISVIFIEG